MRVRPQPPNAPWDGRVPGLVVAAFTLMQLACLGGVWVLTYFAGVGGIAFPVAIVLLVPVRLVLLPRVMRPEHLQALDPVD